MSSYRLRLLGDDTATPLALPEGTSILGSSSACDLRLRHYSVSRRHARLAVENGRVTVEDLGSSNGTLLGEERVSGVVPVEPGSVLSFGAVAARLEAIPPGDSSPAIDLRSDPGFAQSGSRPETLREGETLSLGALRSFALERLPRMLDRLAEEEPRLEALPFVVAELHDGLGSLATVLRRRRDGGEDTELYRRGEGAPTDGGTEPLRVRAADLELELLLPSPLLARSVEPLAKAFLRLATAVRAARPAAETQAHRVESPGFEARGAEARGVEARGAEPPDPPTVVAAVEQLYRDAERVAEGEVNVLICGESGTGKELLARFIHTASRRAAAPFVALNCAALSRDLLEAELFGIDRGVATGVEERTGRFEQADGGTLFLDEVGDMAPETQAKLLRVLQEGELYRVGGRRPRSVDVRILAATNQDIDVLRSRGTFRDDLYYRISDWRPEVPPLRQRRADIPNLAAHFLRAQARSLGRRFAGISRAALDALEDYDWPGNVRQLEREIARAALFVAEDGLLELSHLGDDVRGASPGPAEGSDLRSLLESTERRLVTRALEQHDGDVARAADRLGIGRSTLYRRIKELAIEV